MEDQDEKKTPLHKCTGECEDHADNVAELERAADITGAYTIAGPYVQGLPAQKTSTRCAKHTQVTEAAPSRT